MVSKADYGLIYQYLSIIYMGSISSECDAVRKQKVGPGDMDSVLACEPKENRRLTSPFGKDIFTV